MYVKLQLYMEKYIVNIAYIILAAHFQEEKRKHLYIEWAFYFE